jgi:lipopolysaccharide transport system permease protein
MATTRPEAQHAVILPAQGWVPLRLSELWRSRELLLIFAWRDLSARYRQTLLGVAWAALQPAIAAAVFTVFIGRVVKVPSDGIPYAVFVLAGMVPWTFFANAVSGSSESLVGSSGVITKVYFPRLVLPLGALGAWIPDFFVATGVLLVTMLAYGITPMWTIVFIPLFALGAALVAAAVGITLAPLNVGYRDVRYVSTLLIQLWMFASPVVYPLSRVPQQFRSLYSLNPMVGIVSGYRWAVLGLDGPPAGAALVSGALALAALFGGVTYFRRVEHRLADVI